MKPTDYKKNDNTINNYYQCKLYNYIVVDYLKLNLPCMSIE